MSGVRAHTHARARAHTCTWVYTHEGERWMAECSVIGDYKANVEQAALHNAYYDT